MRSREPIVYFDDQIAQSLGPSKPSKAPKAPTKPAKPPAKPSTPTEPSDLDPIQELCSQIEGLDIEEVLRGGIDVDWFYAS
jgi:hypothetical protein